MTEEFFANNDEVHSLFGKLSRDARDSGYYLNPDTEFVFELLRGLIINEKRLGYQNCPCRLASGNKEEDLDMICPCDYRDPDISEFGACYCALYVSAKVAKGEIKVGSIPERRKTKEQRDANKKSAEQASPIGLPYPVWRCKVCGYLCARDNPPDVCPICKVTKDRFEKFI
jgi:ferredoxin-thioredoxin reductase catalytic subunit